MTCRTCHEEFEPKPGKPGFRDQCWTCGTKSEVPKLGGNMIWEHKTAPSIEIKPLAMAKVFARQQKRFGAGPLKSICTSKETAFAELTREK